jgi:thioesterase domain-containing protein
MLAEPWSQRLAALWAEGIPLAGAMAVEIRRADEEMLVLAAPLEPNRNHMGSAFGGSLHGLATLAGWGVTLMAADPFGARHIIIRASQMRFRAPVAGELIATAALPTPTATVAFGITLARRNRARLTIPVSIEGPGGSIAAHFVGEYVASTTESCD